MDSFELNKIAGAALGALLLAIGSGFVADLVYHGKPAGSAGYALPEPQLEAAAGAPAAPKAEPLPVLLASASPEKGAAAAKKCVSCHSFEKGGPNKVGPHLWGVVDRQRAHEPGFEYSAALKEKGGAWTYAELDHFIANPKGYVAGTKMAFAGITAPQERADVIVYLRTLADSPAPLPAVEKAAAEAKPADAPKGADAAKPTEAKPAEARPAEAAKPAEAKPAEAAKPVEAKPAEAKPAEAKPAEAAKPSEAKPAEAAKPVESTPAETKPAEEKPAEAKPDEKASGDQKPVDSPAEKPAQ